MNHLYVLVLCGGSGTRLWPASREEFPKQFTKLFEGKSLFNLTFERALKITEPKNIFLNTSKKYKDQIYRATPKLSRDQIILEPMRRDTALAHAVGAAYIYKQDPDAVIVNMASDHLIKPISTFSSQLKLAADTAAKHDLVVTIGIKPRYPHSGLGHIKAVKPYESNLEVLLGEKFVEKPVISLATKYTNSGQYYWNANLYVYKAKVYLDLLKKYSPKTYSLLPKLIDAIGTDKEKEVFNLVYQMAPSISIDYAVANHLQKFICIPAKFNWTDIGDWNEVWKNLPRDSQGNVIEGTRGRGEYIGLNSRNNLLFLDKKIVATVGIENMLIVDTPDALLICPKDEAQGVKQVVQALKEQGLDKYL
jgi:mannose-1-phosphate guanylyltransferase